jgi:RHS repeat-associated protein
MKKLVYLFLLLPGLVIAQNYIKSVTYKVPSTVLLPSTTTPSQAQTSVMYFDGLGRPLQQVAVQQSATGQNIVTPITYDSFGRQDKDYLPVPVGTSLDYIDNATVISDPNSYYYNTYGNGGNDWNYRYSEKKFDQSPLSRVLEQGAPGEDWSLANGHTIKMDYLTNVEIEVKLFKAVATYSSSSSLYDVVLSQNPTHYPAESLYKSVVKDENWTSGTLHTTQEFKNKEGQVILKRTYNIISGKVKAHDTYYVYDQYGNLSFVIPPLAANPSTIEVMNNLCYQYKYDTRNRLVEKKLPGKDWEFIVYDKLDRVVATGPVYSPFGTEENGWSVTKYDAFSRPVLTGWYTNGVINSTAREVLQGSYNGTVVNLVKGSSLVDGISVGYAATSLPSGFKLLTVNYYDDYTFPDGPTVFPTGSNNEYEVYYNNSNKKPKGMATGSWIRVLTSASSTDGEKSYTLYDIKGRPVKSYSTNYLGGFISTETKLDFVGKPIYTVTKHLREVGDTPLEIREDFTYSDQDRLLTHVHEIVGQTPPELLTQNEYDEMGQLVKKNVGGNDLNGGMSLQKVDYSYNIRGWLKEINNVDELSMEEPRDLFAFKINYNQPENTLGGQIQELYNGNISETLWTTDSDDLKRSYGYQYDALSRLLKAKYQKQGNETGSYDESLQYDKNGNIRGLQRNGYIDSDDQGMTYPIDDLIYTYDNYNNSNRLLSVYDSSNSLDGFKDGNTSGDDYGYDNYGNMKSDRNKGIDRIYYNHLNLPTKIVFSNSSEIQYLYNAAGVKVMKRVNSTEPNYELEGVTHYLSGFQYKDNELQLFPTAEGYVNVTDGGKFNYVYNYTDHLGNVRVSYSYDDRENELKILEENHYYPFGLKHSYNTDRYDFARDENDNIFVVLEPVDRNKYQYKYNGKEYQDELNLNLYDYGARNYDPAIGRWMNIDPLAENSRRWTPYNYAYNNPMYFVDPDGMQASPIYGLDGNYLGNDAEGFSGEVIFMDEKMFHILAPGGSEMNGDTNISHETALNNGQTLDQVMGSTPETDFSQNEMNMVNSAISDIVSKTSGLQFSMSDLENGSTSSLYMDLTIDGKPNTYFALKGNNGHPYEFGKNNVPASMGGNTMTFNLTSRLWGGEEFTVNNIQNAAVHEGNGHFVNGISGQGKEHANAYQLQMNHSSWKGTTKNWKAEMQKSMEAIIQGRL